MKKIFAIAFVILLFNSEWVYAQNKEKNVVRSCTTSTSNGVKDAISPDDLHKQTGSILPLDFCVKVRAHRVVKSNGTGSTISDALIQNRMNALSTYFEDEIHFVWDDIINVADSDALFNVELTNETCASVNFSPANIFSENTAIDIFFLSHNVGDGNSSISAADGIADGSRIFLSVDNNSLKTATHELGHVLGLFHTYHGTSGGGQDIGNCENVDGYGHHQDVVECLDGTNKFTSGDFVGDTAADYGWDNDGYADILNCQVRAVDTFDDCGSGLQYLDPDMTNFMRPVGYTGSAGNNFNPINCFNHFTPGQISRMKYFISQFSHITSLLTACPVDPDPCDNCTGADNTADLVESSFLNPTCNTVSLSRHPLGDSCDEVRIFWDATLPAYIVLDQGELESHTYTANGNFNLKIEVWRAGMECESAERIIVVPVDCNPPSCEDCDTLGTAIFDSLDTDTCGVYTLDIPDGTLDCYDVVVITDFGTTITLEESDIVNEVFEFTYDENGDYPFAVSLFIPGTFNRCHYSKGGIPVDCFEESSCDWPKTIGTNNPADSPLLLQEYVNAVAEDIDGNIITLGRAKIGADIEGQITTSESYVAKYDECGTLISLINLPIINYPLQMELQDDKSMIILSSDLAPINNASYARNVYLDKVDSTGNHLWRVSINASLINLFRDISFTLNHGNNDVYLQLPRQSLALNGAFVTDSSGYNYKPKRSVVMKFNTNGLLKWKEEIPYTNTGTLVPITQTLDVDYDESNEKLRVLFSGYEGYIAHLETSNVNITIEDITPPATSIRTLVVQYSVNNANIAPVFDSSFPTVIENSSYNQKWIVNNGIYTYISQQEGDVFIYDNAGNYVNEFLLNHKIGDLTHNIGSNSIYTFGVGLGTNNGLGLTKITNETIAWSEIAPANSFPEYAFPLDMVVTSEDKVFLTGVFDNSSPTFESNVGGSDGFILRFKEENGTIVSGFTDDAPIQEIVKSSIDERYNLHIYPNPFSDQFAIDSTKGLVIEQVEIYNAFGILVQSQPYKNGETIYFSKGATGIYFARVYMEGGDVQIINLIKK